MQLLPEDGDLRGLIELPRMLKKICGFYSLQKRSLLGRDAESCCVEISGRASSWATMFLLAGSKVPKGEFHLCPKSRIHLQPGNCRSRREDEV